MKKMAFVIVLLLMVSISVSEARSETPVQMAETFFQMLQRGRISEAYDTLFKDSNIPAAKPQAVTMIKTQTASGLPLYGDIVGFEKVRKEKIGSSIVRLVYILKSEKAPTVWELYFYKAESDWFLANIVFNDQFQLLESKQ